MFTSDHNALHVVPQSFGLGVRDLLDTSTVAELLGCSTRTVTNLFTSGHLPAFRLGPGRTSWRCTETDLLAFVARHGHHDPADVAASTDPDHLPTPATAPAVLTTRRSAEGLHLLELQRPPPDTDQEG